MRHEGLSEHGGLGAGDKSIFEGLEISKEHALCDEYMGKYPVVSISLKGIDALTYETAFQRAASFAARLLQFRQDSCSHRGKACQSPDKIGDWLRQEYAVCPHMERIGQQVGEGDD